MAPELPTGTVTFLFTDVEGSTRLLEELGSARYADALGEHRAIVREALARHGGSEVDTQGDAFFCAFGSARSAVGCAADIRDGLAPTPIRVRMGVHTGEALLVEGHYVGMDVHRAARIGACGHGGQVVLSPTTVALLEPGEFELGDLGEHRLKDLSAPVRMHQLGDERFPPLKTLFRTNLPVPATPFVGREQELAELLARAREPGVRTLTLTGPGGTGKTRLSLQLAAELADQYADGTWWVPLASLGDGSLVASAVAGVLDVDEEPGKTLEASVAAALAGKRLLLVLDNCEHVVDAAAGLVSAVLAETGDVLVVATSREPLDVAGEGVYPVHPLASEDAVQLFHARARSAGAALDSPDADKVVPQLCARLDNLPLAVELAAARAAVIPPAALLDRLSSGLDVLKGPRDAESRQRTLRGTIAWSYGLLAESEQELFRRLAVFAGGGELSAIEDVCDADLHDLLSLVSKSLVRQLNVEGGEPRYWMLETIREFAAEELDRHGEGEGARSRHLEYFAGRATSFRGIEESNAPEASDWLVRMERDVSNMRASFDLASALDRRDEVVALAMALWISHQARGRYSEAADVVRRALVLEPEPLERSWLEEALGRALRIQGHPREALEAFEAAERTLEAVVDRGAYWRERSIELAMTKATFFYFENRPDELASLVAELEPLVEEHGTPEQKAELLHLRTQQAYRLERYAPSAETEALAREAHRVASSLGGANGSPDFMLGFCLLWRGKVEEAEACFSRGRDAARDFGIAIIETRCLVYGTIARRRQNDVEGVRGWLSVLDAQDELHGYKGLTAANAAWLAYRDGDLDAALERGREAFDDWQTEGLRGSRVFEWTARFPLLGVALVQGDLAAAREHAAAMLDDSQQPLPGELVAELELGVAGDDEALARALELARPIGYA